MSPVHRFFTFVANHLQRLTKSLGYSLSGLYAAFQEEFSFRYEVLLFLLGFILAVLFARTSRDVLWLLFPLVLAMVAELLNTAIEHVIDELGGGQHKRAFQIAKDCGSAAVFVLLVFAAFVWGTYFRFF